MTVSPDRASPPADPRWSARDVWSAAFFVGYLAVQVIVPLEGLLDPHFSRFSWKMYACVARPLTFLVEMPDGRIWTLRQLAQAHGPLATVTQLSVDAERFVPPHLCRALPSAVAILTYSDTSSIPSRHACQDGGPR